MRNRRTLLAAGLGSLAAVAGARHGAWAESAANQWFPLQSDDGRPVPNLRAPVELVEEIEELTGAIWTGPADASVKLVEFYDYNCPWCRQAEAARDALLAAETDLRVGIVNNPILSRASAQAAKVDLSVLKLRGAGASIALHRKLFGLPGRIDGLRALDAAAALGFDRTAVERLADSDEVRDTLRRQMAVAASLGLAATPSYVLAGAAILGFPGRATLARAVGNARRCGTVAC